MIKLKQLLFFFLIFNLNLIIGQEKYWVFLSDKNGVEFNPYEYFDSKAIERRNSVGYPLDHYTDRPINENYIQSIQQYADTITGHSRWFNALACILDKEKIQLIEALPFVEDIVPMISKQQICEYDRQLSEGQQSLLTGQTAWMEGDLFRKNNYTGKGIRICIIDAGFPKVDVSSVFSHIRDSNRIINTWDFHKNDSNVYISSSHGTTVLSCIAGIYKGQPIGLATEAEFLLARTERVLTETFSEEEDWLMAIEWADKNGADIINSSLGYNLHGYFKEDMDGQTSIISKAGNIAAKKGMLVISAAGNEGNTNWKYISAPGDADSVLTIGALNPWTGIHTTFSSYGPTSDFRLKPNLMGIGHVMAYDYKNRLHETQGTSFASPLIAGFAACAWQTNPNLTNMEVFKKLEESSTLHPYYDYAHGYGIPQASYFLKPTFERTPTFTIINTEDSIKIEIKNTHFQYAELIQTGTIKEKFINDFFHLFDGYTTEYASIKQDKHPYFYFHIENNLGYLDSYKVLTVIQKNILTLPKSQYKNKTLRFHYRGFTNSINL